MSKTEDIKDAGSNMTAIAEYTQTAAGLAELRQKHQGVVYDVTVPKEMKAAKEARAELRTLRTDLEKKRVEIKAPALERCRLIDEEAKRPTGNGSINEVIEKRKEVSQFDNMLTALSPEERATLLGQLELL